MKIADKTHVTLAYSLNIDSGEEIDRAAIDEPFSFITGTMQVIPGMERQIMDLEEGAVVQIQIEPEEAYGQTQDNLIKEVPKTQFPEDAEIKPNMAFQATGPNGPMTMLVREVKEDTVIADFNHPLAGERLHFDIKIIKVREATEKELQKTTSTGCGCECSEDCSTEDKGSCCS